MLNLATLDQDNAIQVQTSMEKERVVANVTGLEAKVDIAHQTGSIARTAVAQWEICKPEMRKIARKVLAQLRESGTVVRAVMLRGTDNRVVEVCPSDKRKELVDELVDEAKYRGVDELIGEEVEVVLTGELAKWAIKTLPLIASKEIVADNFFVKKHRWLSNSFDKLSKKLREGVAGPELLSLIQRLDEGGYNSPAVEAKIKKG